MQIQTAKILLDGDGTPILVKDCTKNYSGKAHMDEPADVARIMTDVFALQSQAEEFVYLIALNTKMKPVCFFELSHGICNSSIVGMRELFIRVLLCGAVNLILVHNHTSGEAGPSKQDYDVTRRVEEGAAFLGLRFCDHVIVAGEGYFSFREQGILKG